MTRKAIDWEAIERDYRLGQMSLASLGEKHGTTKGAISKKAKQHSWVQDATQEVRQRTRAALLAKQNDEANEGNTVSTTGNAPTQVDIEVAVQTNLAVITRHRKDIAKGQGMASVLMAQLFQAADNREELEDAVIKETEDDENSQRRSRMLKALSLQTHAGVLRDLSTAMKNFIPLERQAYNLDETNTEETYEERLARLMGQQ